LPNIALTPLIIATALFMENLDGTVLGTALPAMALDLHEDPVTLKLALTSYLLSLAVFIPLSGWAADRFGARRVFCTAICVFTFGSILCGLSTSLAGIVLSRTLQGAGGAMMVPVGRLVVLRTAPRSELVQALAWLTIPALVGPLIGPPVGGFIATYAHWRYIFWINVPIGVLGLALSLRFIPNLREAEVPPLDILGAALSGAGLSLLVFGSSVMGEAFMPLWVTLTLMALGAFLLVAYVRHARRVPYPILDLRLMNVPTFSANMYGGFLFRIGIGAMAFLLPLLFQAGFGLSAFESGSLTFIAALGAMVMKPLAQPILRATGFRRALLANTFLSTAFLCFNALFTQQTSHVLIMAALLIGGLFRSLQFTALNAIGFAEIEQADMSRATSFSSVGQQLSVAVGVALSAASLQAARALHGGGDLIVADFAPAFYVAAALTLASTPFFWRLSENAGDELTGRGISPEAEAQCEGPVQSP
jgi:EmrB/QacA subfamily drug resistance transporter